MNKYEPLHNYFLENSDKDEITLTFKEMEEIINDKLPDCLYRRTAGWYGVYNGSPTQVWKKDWCTAGFKAKKVDLKNEIATFIKYDSKDIKQVVHHWIYSAGENSYKWESFYEKGIMAIGWKEIGDLRNYKSSNEINDKLKLTYNTGTNPYNNTKTLWDFVNTLKPGDIIYVKGGQSKILGRGVVSSDYIYDENVDDDYANIRKVDWTNKGEWEHPGKAVQKTLTMIDKYKGYPEELEKIILGDEEPVVFNDFTKNIYLEDEKIDEIISLLRYKKNIILQGTPGSGKTYLAKKLPYIMMGEKDDSKVQIVQFHQNYSYDDFMIGYKPDGEGFKLTFGPFWNFVNKAKEDPEHEYFFIIDEMNRGNINKIFGELFMLLEKDKRIGEESETKVNIPYVEEPFGVPSNLYVIGTMNTADRSLAMLDFALRRRFGFYTLEPEFDSLKFKNYANSLNNSKFNELIKLIKELNEAIKEDTTLGKDFTIGHSFVSGLKEEDINEGVLRNIVKYEIEPLIEEYWYDNESKLNEWKERLDGFIK